MRAAALFLLPLVLSSSPAFAQDENGCVETWPKDREQPAVKDTFPLKGIAGHVSVLEIEVNHLSGETVFPGGLTLLAKSDQAEWLTRAEFKFPDPTSAVRPTVTPDTPDAKAERTKTIVRIPLIPLPAEAGRKDLTLPRLPISIARASGQVHTICTAPHVISVEDPLASSPQAEPRPDPEPRPQIEVWHALRDAVLAILIALPIAALLAWLFVRFRKSFTRVPAPPPPRPPWETALLQLEEIENQRLLDKKEYEQFLDAVSDTLREYLGARYGFDGLESTTHETLRQLSALASDFQEERAVRSILQRADLVKFARRLPSEEECSDALAETKRLIRLTTVAPSLDPRSKPATNSKQGGQRA